MMADIYQTSQRAYLGVDSVIYFDLEIKVILDKQTFDKYQESNFTLAKFWFPLWLCMCCSGTFMAWVCGVEEKYICKLV